MANKALFSREIVRNHAGGASNAKTAEQALTQYAVTGTFNDGCYQTGEGQLNKVIELAQAVSDEFLAKLAVYSRTQGHMKDMPAMLLAMLTARGSDLVDVVFDRVIDNGKMLRNFVQIMRSGVVGRKSLGSKAKRLVKAAIARMDDYALWNASVGNEPSLVDVMKLAHPKARDEKRNALYGYLMGKPVDVAMLPVFIREYEQFVKGERAEAPLRVPFQKLTALPLKTSDWKRIAMNMKWEATRMNLNTFGRHGLYADRGVVGMIAERLSDRAEILRARVFPYQLMTTLLNIDDSVPVEIKQALGEALQVSLENVPKVEGNLVIAVDISRSMANPASGYRAGATTKVRCVDVAALVGAAMIKNNPTARLVLFNNGAREFKVNRDATVMVMAEDIRSMLNGGTNCGSVVRYLMQEKIKADHLVMISDNESWVGDTYHSQLSTLWAQYKRENKQARMINLDITPNEFSASDTGREDTLLVGGFSDEVFNVMARFLNKEVGVGGQVNVVHEVEL
ncbi:60 kDa SS-A/Ro ribonucleoprotein [Pseudomonas nitritireducens]|uniref:60 kDa SS-A/Ro ribonucleoprotein n=1 Tax=Pseudomonas nitroreducens TaxID=46680 RepID=A0A7W7P408_PSENT|nr:TROVE domain-containing protein [Pseudomonas nitritireducens]MBB4867563.1 60 kDa SS-A/Ro ribonucleoprotein [Pseudomonas nitritireducens]